MTSAKDQFTLLGRPHCSNVFEDYEDQSSAKYTDLIISLMSSIRHNHAEMTVSLTSSRNVDLIYFANAGHAVAELDSTDDAFIRSRFYSGPLSKDDPGRLYDDIIFGRYKYIWNNLEFIVYTVSGGYDTYQFVLFPPDDDETVLSNSKATDALLVAIGQFENPYTEGIFVYDGYWSKNHGLYEEVQKISWKDVILDENKKKALTKDIEEFFDNESKYKDFDVPWKRGIIFYGPPGNGKTFSLRALMHSLTIRKDPINVLYVKSMNSSYDLRNIFVFARVYAPCLLIIEDIDSLITNNLQSYFFNEVDGLENNNGILMIATTNHLDKLDGGIANRPSRFDRKYEFPVPSTKERVMYCDSWRRKLEPKPIEFPAELSHRIAGITAKFSFAYLKEAFVSSLLALVRAEIDGDPPELECAGDMRGSDNDGDDIDDLPLWIEMQKQVKILRDEMDARVTQRAPGLLPFHAQPTSLQTPDPHTQLPLTAEGGQDIADMAAQMAQRVSWAEKASISNRSMSEQSQRLLEQGRYPTLWSFRSQASKKIQRERMAHGNDLIIIPRNMQSNIQLQGINPRAAPQALSEKNRYQAQMRQVQLQQMMVPRPQQSQEEMGKCSNLRQIQRQQATGSRSQEEELVAPETNGQGMTAGQYRRANMHDRLPIRSRNVARVPEWTTSDSEAEDMVF